MVCIIWTRDTLETGAPESESEVRYIHSDIPVPINKTDSVDRSFRKKGFFIIRGITGSKKDYLVNSNNKTMKVIFLEMKQQYF